MVRRLNPSPKPKRRGKRGELPQLVSCRTVTERLGCTRSSLEYLIRHGEFPAPIRVGRKMLRWRLDELLDHLERRSVT